MEPSLLRVVNSGLRRALLPAWKGAFYLSSMGISYTLCEPADAGFQLKYESFTQKRSIRRREAREESRCSKIGCRFHQDVGACVADRTRIRRLHLFSPQWKKF